MDLYEPPQPLSRRRLLGMSAGIGIGAALAGCKVQTSSDQAGGTGTPAAGEITLPSPNAALPSGSVTYRAMMTGGIKQPYFQAVWRAFEQAHPNIKMQLDATSWDRIDEVVPLGIRNKTAPDLFQMPRSVPVQVAVNEGWVTALEDFVPDFATWKAGFPAAAFIPGVHVFDGKTYSWTFTSSRSQYPHLLFFDTKLMAATGLDPVAERLTWSTFRETAKKITVDGRGKSFGLITHGAGLGTLVLNLAELAGLPGGMMDFATGEYNYTHPLLREAIDLLLAVRADGSIFPGFLTIDEASVAARFPQGIAGMTFAGAWNVTEWRKTAPSYQYGLAMPPSGDDKKLHHTGFVEGTAAPLFAYSGSKNHAITGELFRYIGSVEGQAMMVNLSGGIFSSEIEEANVKARRDYLAEGHAKEAGRIMSELRVTQPLPQVANPDVAKVILEQKAVKPSFDDVVQGIFTGQVSDISTALKDVQDRSDKALDDAIAAARKKGAKVSRDDWKFANWDPEKNYDAADYKAR